MRHLSRNKRRGALALLFLSLLTPRLALGEICSVTCCPFVRVSCFVVTAVSNTRDFLDRDDAEWMKRSNDRTFLGLGGVRERE
jgi:hypothetical protein